MNEVETADGQVTYEILFVPRDSRTDAHNSEDTESVPEELLLFNRPENDPERNHSSPASSTSRRSSDEVIVTVIGFLTNQIYHL